MTENKLVVVIMGQNCEKFIGMCLNSVKDADAIVYCDGGSKDNTLKMVKDFDDNTYKKLLPNTMAIIQQEYNQEDKAMNGKQRNFYLDYVKKQFSDYWCLVLDADEIVEDLSKIKELIQTETPCIFNVKMRHFIGDLGHEDATHETHWVPNRLFYIPLAKEYPLHSHPILNNKQSSGNTACTTIWHLGHLPIEYMDYILKRYKQHSNDSLIHTQQFLLQWKYSHLFGGYPTIAINPLELPKQIVERYEIDNDMFYQQRYQLEMKNVLMVKQWYDYFKPDNILELGCGRGCYLYFWNWFEDEVKGIDNSKWAIEHTFVPGKVELGECYHIKGEWDLITAIDLLEHLDDTTLHTTLTNMALFGNRFLFSIPFEGDPNLTADSTHKQFHNKEWWINKLSQYFNIKDAPKEWLFSNQLLIGEKK